MSYRLYVLYEAVLYAVVYPLLNLSGELGVLLRFRRTETPQRQQTPLDAPSRNLRKTNSRVRQGHKSPNSAGHS